MNDVPRVVLDTNVWLDVIVFVDPRVSALCDAITSHDVVAVSTNAMRDEFRCVLDYPIIGVAPPHRDAALASFDDLATHVEHEPPTTPAPRCRDPDDQMFVDLAIAVGASWLLTRDAELLRLRTRLARFGVDVLQPADWRPD